VFVQVETDRGIVGLGEASHSTDDGLVRKAIENLESGLVGSDPLDINRFRIASRRNGGGRVTATAAGAVEQALWDICGQRLGAPIHALLGGKVRDRVRLYANINRRTVDRSPDDFAAAAAAAVADGFTAVKIAPFDELHAPDRIRTGRGAACALGIERVAAVRQAVGDDIELAVDCHARMEPSEAIAVGRRLERYDLLWYEEPVSCLDPAGLKAVSSSVGIATASAESLFAVEGFRPFLCDRIVDVLMPDVKHCGGIAELVDLAGAARIKELLVAPHNPSGPVAAAASAHAVAGLENFLILEYAWGEVPWRAELLDPPERIEDGCLVLSDRPGLGHRLREDRIAN
jgi:galactonate dehydratase